MERTAAAAQKTQQTRQVKQATMPIATAGATVELLIPAARTPKHGAAAFVRQRALGDAAGLGAAQLGELYYFLTMTRRIEEHLVALYRQNKVIGGVYRSLGQEATAVGCAYALRDGDIIAPVIRDLGAMLVHGIEPIALFRQYMARATGPSGGRDLNAHFSDPQRGMVGPISMLGAMIPVLAGCLIAARRKGEARVGLGFAGDGGSSTGAFYEGLNFAAVQKLPLITVVEVNQYAYSTPTANQVPDGDLVRRAMGFGVPVLCVDGNDILACFEATRWARRRALAGDGASVVVAETYRRRGHAEHDNQSYVPDGEVDDWATNNDPVTRFESFLTTGGHFATAQLEAIRGEVEAELNRARDAAVLDPFPDPSTQQMGVFADGTQPIPSSDTWFRGGPRHRETQAP